MLKYTQVLDEVSKRCAVGMGTNAEVYERMGMKLMDVEEAYDGDWYLAGYAPEKPVDYDLNNAKAEKAADFDAVMAAIDRKLIRPLANGETERVDELNRLQAQNRVLRARVMAAETVDEVNAVMPVTLEGAADGGASEMMNDG